MRALGYDQGMVRVEYSSADPGYSGGYGVGLSRNSAVNEN